MVRVLAWSRKLLEELPRLALLTIPLELLAAHVIVRLSFYIYLCILIGDAVKSNLIKFEFKPVLGYFKGQSRRLNSLYILHYYSVYDSYLISYIFVKSIERLI